jgi:hypothetical protein
LFSKKSAQLYGHWLHQTHKNNKPPKLRRLPQRQY